jgi:propanol-preferring alcohol dehydrogenase
MKAMVLPRPGPIETAPLQATDLPEPAPGPGELLLDVSACGVCRTDLQLVEGDLEAHRLPVIPGHQIVGRVAAAGPGVTGWTVGERAGAGWPAGSCGTCGFCRSGRENLCEQARFTGWDRDGGFATRAVVDAAWAVRLPERFTDLAAAPLLCGGAIGYRSLRISGIRPGERLGLYGFGASALLAIQVAVHWGCEVYVATRSPAEQQRAREMGAVWAAGYEDAPPVPLDAAITFAPVGEVVVAALAALDRGGVVAVNAIHLDRIPEFAYRHLWWERQIRSVANATRRDLQDFIDLAARIPVHTVAHAFPLEEANAALARLKQGRVAGAAVLVAP